MGKTSRAKGRRAQTQGSQLLEAAGWQCVDTSAGTAVEDVFAIDRHSATWAVELTADQSISLAAKWRQAEAQAAERGAAVRPLMLWKVDRAGWWLVLDELVAEPMRARPLELELCPSTAMSFTTAAKQLHQLRPRLDDDLGPVGAMPVLCTARHVAAPAELALRRWWA